jgi:hypothetical protein
MDCIAGDGSPAAAHRRSDWVSSTLHGTAPAIAGSGAGPGDALGPWVARAARVVWEERAATGVGAVVRQEAVCLISVYY